MGWWGGPDRTRGRHGPEPVHRRGLLVFKLGAHRRLPPLRPAAPLPEPPPLRASEETVKHGAELFANTCAQCHGQLAVGGVKDLRYMTRAVHASFNDIVLKGLRVQKGMANFSELLSPADVEAIHAYVISRAQEDWGRPEGAH